jgi:hypothetical protein
VSEGTANPIFLVSRNLTLPRGETEVRATIAHLPLPRGRFYLWMGIARKGKNMNLLGWQPISRFDVEGSLLDHSPAGILRLAPVHVGVDWQVETR